jgi:hypothetical protein
MEKNVRVFTLYAREDENIVDQLTIQLSLWKRKQLITDYHDKEVSSPIEWDDASLSDFLSSNLLLFVLSPALQASGYERDEMIGKAVKEAGAGEKEIAVVFARNCDLQNEPLTGFTILPSIGQPIESALWQQPEQAWKTLFAELRELITGERQASDTTTLPPANTVAAAHSRKGTNWQRMLTQLLWSIVALTAMGSISYYLINYDPKKQGVAADVPAQVGENLPVENPAEIIPPVPEPPSETAVKEKAVPAPVKTSKTSSPKRADIRVQKDTIKKKPADSVKEKKEEPLVPAVAGPSIKSEQLEQMLVGFSQGTVNENEIASYLCNKLETPVRYNKKSMNFLEMCKQIKDVKARKIKKISVLSTSFEKGCISWVDVALKKKGLFN